MQNIKQEYIRLGEYEHLRAMAHKRGLRDRDDPRWAILNYHTHSPIKVKQCDSVLSFIAVTSRLGYKIFFPEKKANTYCGPTLNTK